ncbi:hypothetical protein KEM54_002474 [Ascosphaera aggregata]|nr:hypothetical protein KEM54_002474 [Ascosphaera aggregata]
MSKTPFQAGINAWTKTTANGPGNKREYIKYGDSNSVIASQPPPMPAPIYYAPPPPQPQPSFPSQLAPPPSSVHHNNPPPLEPQPHLPQVATFESPRKSPTIPQEAGGAKFNPDSLPHMPAWSEAKTRYVEEEPLADNVEMNNLPPVVHPPPRQTTPLAQSRNIPATAPLRQMTPLGAKGINSAAAPAPAPPAIPQPPPLSNSPVPRIATPSYDYNENTPLNPKPSSSSSSSSAAAAAAAAAWHHDPYYDNNGQESLGYNASAPLPIPTPNHQHYAQPNTAPYPHSMAGDHAGYDFGIPEYGAQPQESYGYADDHWNHPSVQLQQQQQQQYQQLPHAGAGEYGYAQTHGDYSMNNNNDINNNNNNNNKNNHNNHNNHNMMYSDSQDMSSTAATRPVNGVLPGTLAPGPRQGQGQQGPLNTQRQSAELGF